MEDEINVTIVSKDRKFWLDFKTKIEESILSYKREIEVNEHLLSLVAMKLIEFRD